VVWVVNELLYIPENKQLTHLQFKILEAYTVGPLDVVLVSTAACLPLLNPGILNFLSLTDTM